MRGTVVLLTPWELFRISWTVNSPAILHLQAKSFERTIKQWMSSRNAGGFGFDPILFDELVTVSVWMSVFVERFQEVTVRGER
jgi:hypothetical protein